MMRPSRWILPALLLLGLLGCGTPRKSVFPPAVSVQQLHVNPDGSWRMQVRLQNNSYTGMNFQALHLTMTVNQQPAATLDASLDLDIPEFAADVTHINVKPSAPAAAALAAIVDKGSAGSMAYALKGSVTAQPDKASKPRSFDVAGHDWLSPVPGIPNTFR